MKLSIQISLIVLANLFFISSSANAYTPDAINKYNQAIDFSKKGMHKEAILALEEAVKVDPNLTDAYFNMAVIYEHLKLNDAALEVYKKIVNINKKDYESIYKVALLYYKKKQPAKALAYLFLMPKDVKEFSKCKSLYKDILGLLDKQAKPTNESKIVDISNKNEKNKVYKGFEGPTGITQDSLGNVYVASYLTDTIIKINKNGERTVFMEGQPINGPISITIDKQDNIYVANYISSDIVKISQDGQSKIVLQDVQKPYFVYVNKNRNLLYVSEQRDNTVIRLNLSKLE